MSEQSPETTADRLIVHIWTQAAGRLDDMALIAQTSDRRAYNNWEAATVLREAAREFRRDIATYTGTPDARPASSPASAVTDQMIDAALATEIERTTLRALLDAQLRHLGAYGNAKALVRRALENAMKEQAHT